MLAFRWLVAVSLVLALFWQSAPEAALAPHWERHPPAATGRSTMADVLGIVLHTHFRQPYTTTHVMVRSETAAGRRVLQELLTALLAEHVHLVVQYVGEDGRHMPGGPRPWRRPWSHTLLLAESYAALSTVYGQLTPARFDFAGYYLIVLAERDTPLATVDRIFHDLWQRQIVNVVVTFGVPAEARAVPLWTYFPYSPGLCRVPKPHLLLTWPNDTLLYGVSFFPRKNARFHGCPLRVGTFETRPFTVLSGPPEAPRLAGFEGDLLASAAEKLGFATNLRVPPHSQQWGEAAFENSTGMMRMIYSEEVDLGIACLGVSSERSAMLKPGKVHFTTELVVVVPPGRPYTPIEKLFLPFGAPLWGALLAYLVLGLLAIGAAHRWPPGYRYLVGRRVQAPAMNVLRVLFGSPVPRAPTANFPRTLLLLWIELCLVLQIAYQGSLFMFLQRASHRPPMATLDEIDRADVRYHVAESARRFFVPFPRRLAHLQYFPPGPDSIAARLRWLGQHPDDPDVTMCTRDHVAYYNLLHRRRLQVARETMALYSVTILYPKRSMLTSSFDEHIERIESSGLLKYWVARYGDYRFLGQRSTGGSPAEQATPPAPISVAQLSGAFQLLLGLLALSGLLLVGEIYWARRKAALLLTPGGPNSDGCRDKPVTRTS